MVFFEGFGDFVLCKSTLSGRETKLLSVNYSFSPREGSPKIQTWFKYVFLEVHLWRQFFPVRRCNILVKILSGLLFFLGELGLPRARDHQPEHDRAVAAHVRRGAAADLHADASGLLPKIRELADVQGLVEDMRRRC